MQHSRYYQTVLFGIQEIQLHRMSNATCAVYGYHISHGGGAVVARGPSQMVLGKLSFEVSQDDGGVSIGGS